LLRDCAWGAERISLSGQDTGAIRLATIRAQ
jgi:hypothetical protein